MAVAEILARQRARDVAADRHQTGVQFLLFLGLEPLPSGCARVRPAVALFLDAHDVAGAAQRDQQVCPVLGREERAQGLDPGEQADQIVLFAGREYGADQVVAHAAVLQVHLEPVGEEAQQLSAHRIGVDLGQQIAVAGKGLREGGPQRQPQPVFQDQPDGAERGAAQRERIL